MRSIIAGAMCFSALIFCSPVAISAENVDLKLVLLSDVSDSMNDRLFEQERQGYARALVDPRVLRAIQAGPHQAIAVTYVEWSDTTKQKVIADWTVLRNARDAEAFARVILSEPRPFGGWTSISAAIDFAVTHLKSGKTTAERHIIDISGDGRNNSGRPSRLARDSAVANGITINGLVVINPTTNPALIPHVQPPEGLPEYYREHVIGGPDHFIAVVEDIDSFAESLTRKLLSEIARIETLSGAC
jgi:hypothetical protein